MHRVGGAGGGLSTSDRGRVSAKSRQSDRFPASAGARASGTAVYVICPGVPRHETSATRPRPSAGDPPETREPVREAGDRDDGREPSSPAGSRPTGARARPLVRRGWVQWAAAAVFLAVTVSASIAVMPDARPRGTTRAVQPHPGFSSSYPAQLRSLPAHRLPVSYSGTGSGLEGPFAARGSFVVSTTNSSSRSQPFRVEVLDANGRTLRVLFDSGPGRPGRVTVTGIGATRCFLNVHARGRWTLAVS